MLNNPENNQQQFSNDDDNDRNLNAAVPTVAAPPPPPSTTNLKPAKAATSRAAMFDQIRNPTQLRKTTITSDKSAPLLKNASDKESQQNPNEPKFEDQTSQLSVKEKMSKLSADKKPLQAFEDSDDKKLGRKIESIINLEDDLKSKTQQNSLEVQEKLLSTKIAKIEAHYTELTNAIAARKNHNSGLNHLLRELSENNLTRDDNFSEITSIRKKLDSENKKLSDAQNDLSAEWENLRKTTAKACLAANQARIDTNSKSIAKATIEAKALIKSVYQYGDVTSSSSSTEEDDKNVETKFQELTNQQRALKAAKAAKNKKIFTNDSGVINKEVMIAELLDITANFPAELDAFTKQVRKSIEEAVNTPKVMPTNIDDLHSEIARLRRRIAELEASGKTQDAANVQQMVANLESSVQLAQSDNKVLQKLALLDDLTKQIADQAKELERLKAIENENEILQEQTNRAKDEVDSHRLAAAKLQQDAQNLKKENGSLLEELKARRDEIQGLASAHEQNKAALAAASSKLQTAESNRDYWARKSEETSATAARERNALTTQYSQALAALNVRANRSLWAHFAEEASTSLGSLGTAFISNSFVLGALSLECTLLFDMIWGRKGQTPLSIIAEPVFPSLAQHQLAPAVYIFTPLFFSGLIAATNSRSSCDMVAKFLASSAIMFAAFSVDAYSTITSNTPHIPNIFMNGAILSCLDVFYATKVASSRFVVDLLVPFTAYSYLMDSIDICHNNLTTGLLNNFGNALAVTACAAYGRNILDNTASPEAKTLACAIIVGASTAALSYFGTVNPALALGTFAASVAMSSLRDRSQPAQVAM